MNLRVLVCLVSLPLFAGALSCSTHQAERYVPVLASPSASPQPAGTFRGDFDAAARSASPEEAFSHWLSFIERYEPGDEEYEDEFQKNLLDTARFELARACYLTRRTATGDSVLKAMNPLHL